MASQSQPVEYIDESIKANILRNEKIVNLFNSDNKGKDYCNNRTQSKKDVLETIKSLDVLPYLSQSATTKNTITKNELCDEMRSVLDNPSHPSFTSKSDFYDGSKLDRICEKVTENGTVGNGEHIVSRADCKLNKKELLKKLSKLVEETREPQESALAVFLCKYHPVKSIFSEFGL